MSGRPTKYRSEFAEQVYKLALLGATDAEMADILGVTEATFHSWKKIHRDFLESITRGKTVADANVAERLYQRAMGYEHDEDKIFQHEGEPVIVPTRKHYPPDTQAASLWLRNRQPGRWRDKQEVEHSGKVEHVEILVK